MSKTEIKSCSHDMIYWGVVNVNVRNEYLGSIDLWKCRSCRILSVEEKRVGNLALSPDLGFPYPPTNDSKWAVLICATASRTLWEVKCVKPSDSVSHGCVEKELEHKVSKDYSIKDKKRLEGVNHYLFLLEDYTNETIEINPPTWSIDEK